MNEMTMIFPVEMNRAVAGVAGLVIVYAYLGSPGAIASVSYWFVPGTFDPNE